MPRQFALKVQDKYDKGWRKEASKLGQLWDVYRDDVLIAANVFYMLTKWNRGQDIEAEKGTNFYRARGTRKFLQIGDQLVGKDVASKREQSALLERHTIVGMRLLRDNIAIRTEWACKIYRPTMVAETGCVENPYSFQTVLNSPVLERTGSTWAWAPAGSDGTEIWCDINTALPTDYAIPDPVPTTTRSQGWTISFHLLPGVELAEGDMIVDSLGNWFRIQRMDKQFAAASLYQMGCTKVMI